MKYPGRAVPAYSPGAPRAPADLGKRHGARRLGHHGWRPLRAVDTLGEVMPDLTKSQVNKAGKLLRRRFQSGVEDPPPDATMEAFELLWTYRAAHQYPLTKASMGLRSVVKTEGCAVEVSQRLKRLPTIINKLMRQPTMQLSTMQDIAGCRAVLASMDEVRRVQKRFSKNRPPLRVTGHGR